MINIIVAGSCSYQLVEAGFGQGEAPWAGTCEVIEAANIWVEFYEKRLPKGINYLLSDCYE